MDRIIEKALKNFDNFLKDTNWYGRENEVVNIFAHKFLAEYVGEKPLLSLDQLGIEVAVKQLDSEKGKELVRKDLVIWKYGDTSVWNEKGEIINNPLVIIEWKVNDVKKCSYDIGWLGEYTRKYPDVTGYSVCTFMIGKRGLQFQRIVNSTLKYLR